MGHAIQINSKQVLIDAEDERNAVSEGNHSGLYPMVCSVRAQLPEPRGNDVGARARIDTLERTEDGLNESLCGSADSGVCVEPDDQNRAEFDGHIADRPN